MEWFCFNLIAESNGTDSTWVCSGRRFIWSCGNPSLWSVLFLRAKTVKNRKQNCWKDFMGPRNDPSLLWNWWQPTWSPSGIAAWLTHHCLFGHSHGQFAFLFPPIMWTLSHILFLPLISNSIHFQHAIGCSWNLKVTSTKLRF